MDFRSRLEEDLKIAMKAGAQGRTGLLRFLLAQIHNQEIEKFRRTKDSKLSDEEVAAILQREVKKRKEAIALFRQGSREELVKREEEEVRMIEEYLPEPASQTEIEQVIEALFSSGIREFAPLMREAMRELKGKADGRVVGDAVKKKLSG